MTTPSSAQRSARASVKPHGTGRGVRLTAADVAKLVGDERERFAGRLAKVGRAPKGRKRDDNAPSDGKVKP